MKFELLSEDRGVRTWKISAIHVTRSGNGRLYTKQELVQAAETLSFRPININHDPARRLPYPDNCTLHPMIFDGAANAVVGSMRIADAEVNKKIESGQIDHLSVEQMSNETCSDALCSSKLQYGVAFTGLALLEKGVQAGDPKTSIKAESAADVLISDMVQPCKCSEQVSSFVNKDGSFRQMSTQPELAKINREANIKIPGVLDDRIVGFTAEQFETIKNYEQRQLDTLTSLLTKVESVIPRPDGVPSSPVSNGTDSKLESFNAAVKAFEDVMKRRAFNAMWNIDKEQWLADHGYSNEPTAAIKTEAVTFSTAPQNYARKAIYIPGGRFKVPLRQFCNVQVAENADRVNWYTMTSFDFGAITEGTAPSEVATTLAPVSATPAVRGAFIKVNYSQAENAPVAVAGLVNAINDRMMLAALDDESADVMSVGTSVSSPTNWVNGNSGAAVSADTTFGTTNSLALAGVAAAKRLILNQGHPDEGLVLVTNPKAYFELLTSSGISTYVQQGKPFITMTGRLEEILGVRIVVSKAAAGGDATSKRSLMLQAGQTLGLGSARELMLEADRRNELQQIFVTGTQRIKAAVLDETSSCRISTSA